MKTPVAGPPRAPRFPGFPHNRVTPAAAVTIAAPSSSAWNSSTPAARHDPENTTGPPGGSGAIHSCASHPPRGAAAGSLLDTQQGRAFARNGRPVPRQRVPSE